MESQWLWVTPIPEVHHTFHIDKCRHTHIYTHLKKRSCRHTHRHIDKCLHALRQNKPNYEAQNQEKHAVGAEWIDDDGVHLRMPAGHTHISWWSSQPRPLPVIKLSYRLWIRFFILRSQSIQNSALLILSLNTREKKISHFLLVFPHVLHHPLTKINFPEVSKRAAIVESVNSLHLW